MRLTLSVVCLAVPLYLGAATPVSDVRLLDAVKRRDVQAAETLLRTADLNVTAPDGSTPLSWAVFLDLGDLAGKLIDAGAKVNTVTEYGETPLTLALANGNAALTQKLLKVGADPKVARWNGETALMIAAGVGSVDEVRLLLDRGVDVNGADPKRKQNALMWAASEGHSAVVDLLIQRGAAVNAVSVGGFSALVFAALKDDGASVKLLLAAGADPDFALADGTKVLSAATSSKCYAAAMALLNGHANPNISDKAGNTPLHVAAQAGALELVNKLLAAGAPVNARNAKTESVGFRSQPGEQTALLLAARFDHVDVMRSLIGAHADVTVKGQDGAGLLLAASASGRADAARYAFEFDKDVKAVDNAKRNAMHLTVNPGNGASQEQMTELVEFLASIGVPLDDKDGRGRTPIQIGDVIPLDKPIQRIAEIIVGRGGTPVVFPKEYIKPKTPPKPIPAPVP